MRAAYLVTIVFAAGLVGGAIAAWVITTPKPAFARDAETPLDGQGDASAPRLPTNIEIPDNRYRRLLRVRRDRPRRRGTTQNTKKFPPPHRRHPSLRTRHRIASDQNFDRG